ncbi:MAG TPA: site-2 protease family protein [Anaerolineales bacterium]|nr:site-2 protease family protein [Anaerolineales bacterium]
MSIPYTQSLPYTSPIDPYSLQVKRVLSIEEITWGDEKQYFLVRYRGRLIEDAAAAYEKLSTALHSMDVIPLFREEAGKHTIALMKGSLRTRPSNPWINLVLFILTLLSMLFAGILAQYNGPLTTDLSLVLPYLLPTLGQALAFTASLLAILMAHEFGHYLAARYHRTAVTLPYFIPFPLSPFGTMGAFIQLKEPPRNKRILLDIGIAGPMAGLVVALPVLMLGLYLSKIDQLPGFLHSGQSFSLEGNSILYLFVKFLVFGQWLPHPLSFGDLNPFIYWIRYFFTGQPIPFGGQDVLLHPVAWAGWAGLLITALNLIPAGQLDGGHVLFVLLGKKARTILPFVLVLMIALGTVWSGWWLWAFLIFVFGRVYAEPLDQITTLDTRRKALAILGLLIFVLVFTPIPLSMFSG